MADKLATFIKTEYTGRQVPDFKVGDVVKVHQLVPDIKAHEVGQKLSKTAKAAMKAAKKKEVEESSRIQIFEGIVIARKHGKEPGASFTVRKIASGNVGVEKIFPLYSPLVTKIEVVSRPKVRRAKLYFLREQVGKRARKFGTGKSVDQKVTRVSDLIVPGSDISAGGTEEVAADVVAGDSITEDTAQPNDGAVETPQTESSEEPAVAPSEEKTE